MTPNEKTALLSYLEFNLTLMVEKFQMTLTVTHQDNISEIIGPLWEGAAEVLAEIERTINDDDSTKLTELI